MEYRSTIQPLPNETKLLKYGFTLKATGVFQWFRQSGRCFFFVREVRTERLQKCAQIVQNIYVVITIYPSCFEEML